MYTESPIHLNGKSMAPPAVTPASFSASLSGFMQSVEADAAELLEGLKHPPHAASAAAIEGPVADARVRAAALSDMTNASALREVLGCLRTMHEQTALAIQTTEDQLVQYGYKRAAKPPPSEMQGTQESPLSALPVPTPREFSPSSSLAEIGLSAFTMSLEGIAPRSGRSIGSVPGRSAPQMMGESRGRTELRHMSPPASLATASQLATVPPTGACDADDSTSSCEIPAFDTVPSSRPVSNDPISTQAQARAGSYGIESPDLPPLPHAESRCLAHGTQLGGGSASSPLKPAPLRVPPRQLASADSSPAPSLSPPSMSPPKSLASVSPPRSIMGLVSSQPSDGEWLPPPPPSSPPPPPSSPPPPPLPPPPDEADNLFPLMAALTTAEFESAPAYLRHQLSMPLDRLNECIEAVNECVTDKRFSGTSDEYVTQDELSHLLRLGARSRTQSLVLFLLHCGRLRSLDAKRSDGSAGGSRYRIAGGSRNA